MSLVIIAICLVIIAAPNAVLFIAFLIAIIGVRIEDAKGIFKRKRETE